MCTAPTAVRTLLAAAVVGLPALPCSSCYSMPVVEVELLDPNNLRDTAKFAQLVIFDGRCPDDRKLGKGDISGHKWMQSTTANGKFTKIGRLEKAPHGFAALLRNENCGVMGYGCTFADLEHHRRIVVAVNNKGSPADSACDADEICSNSVCRAGSAEAGVDGDADAGPLACGLNLIAAADFELPTQGGTLYAGPAVVATPSGFVVMYREADPAGTQPRGVRLGISDDGEPRGRENFDLPPCRTDIATDGFGAAWNSLLDAGLLVISMPSCDSEPARVHVSNFDRDGKGLRANTYPLPSSFEMSPVKAVAAAPGTNRFLVASMAGAAPFLFEFDGVAVIADPPPRPIHEGYGAATSVQVASTEGTRATLTDSVLESGRIIVTVEDTGSGSSSTNLFARTSIASVAVWGNRAAIIQPDSADLTWAVFEKSGSAVDNGKVAGGPYTAVDIVQIYDYLLVAGAKAGSVTVFRFDDINGTMSRSSTLQTELSSAIGGGDADLSSFQGERVAIAAARGRVVVAWLTSTAALTGTSMAPGGFAVLSCDG